MSKIIVALDIADKVQLQDLLAKLDPKLCRIKLGLQIFTRLGPDFVRNCQDQGFEVFLDLKFHDIPNQVYNAVTEAARLGVWMVNVHALGGIKMMLHARKAIDSVAAETGHKPLLIGVTILTSHNDSSIADLGLSGTVNDNVLKLANSCYQAKLDGVVCSAHEVKLIKQEISPDFLCITPGIRLAGDSSDDQQRILTPEAALQQGSDYLVIGRSITNATQPSKVLGSILA